MPAIDGGDHELRFVGSGLRMPERVVRMSIAAMVPIFGVIGVIMLFSGEGPGGTAGRVVVVVVSASTVPMAVVVARANLAPIWWGRRSRAWGVNNVFVIYGDVGVSAVLFTFSHHEAALFGTLLFAILSAYVANFCSTTIRTFHIVFTTTVIVVLSVLTWHSGDFGMASIVARCLIAVAVVNGTLLLQSMFAFSVRRAIRDTLLHAHQDPLTSLWNRRGFTYWATATVKASTGPVGLLIVDIDFYKSINDTHGHLVGDDVLQRAARSLEGTVGDRGVLARTGGDEFAIAAELTLPQLVQLADDIRLDLARAGDTIPMTASVGVAVTHLRGDPDQVLSTLLDAADTALYEAKAAGRDRVACVNLTEADHRVRVVDHT